MEPKKNTKQPKLPPMYYANPDDKQLIREADYMSENSSDPMNSLGYQGEESLEPWPARGVKGAGAGPTNIDKLRKKGMPRGKQSGES